MALKGKISPIRKNILVCDMEFGEEKTKTGILIQNLNGKLEGIKPRWGKIWAVGPEVDDVNVGDWILISHGRWSRGIEIEDVDGSLITIRRIDNEEILLVSDEKPEDIQLGNGL